MEPDDELLPMSEGAWVAGTLVFYVPAGLAAVGWIGLRHGWAEAAARVGGASPARDLVLGLLAGGLVVGATRLGERAVPGVEPMARALGRLLGPVSLGGCLLVALLSGVGEELVFRAALQPGIGPVWATLAFAAVHVPFERELWAWPLFALVVGALLAALYAFTGAALAPIVAHVTINAFNLRWVATRWGD